MTDFAKARKNMVDGQIHTAGVVDTALLNAFATVPREQFVPEKIQDVAYFDETIDLGQKRFLIEPIAHAKMLQAALPVEGDVVLDVGSGTGYSSAILSHIVTTVISVENNKRQIEKATRLWAKLDYTNIVHIDSPLVDGASKYAPYSLIVLNGSVTQVPKSILDQVDFGGRLVTIIKKPSQQVGQAFLFIKNEDGVVSSRPLFDAGVPYIEGFEPVPVFQF